MTSTHAEAKAGEGRSLYKQGESLTLQESRALHAELSYRHRLAEYHPYRRSVNSVVTSKWFEGFLFLVIVCNCLTIATVNFSSFRPYQAQFDIADDVFTCIFTVEMLLKMVALGVFVKHRGYFHSKWNIMDFIITIAGLADLITQLAGFPLVIGEFQAARSFRLLRPLRALSVLGSLRLILNSIVTSLRRLLDVLLLGLCFTIVMALIAQQFFDGTLGHRCYTLEEQFNASLPIGNQYSYQYERLTDSPVCGGSTNASIAFSSVRTPALDPPYVVAESDAPEFSYRYFCPYNSYCMPAENPENGFISYDNLLATFMSLYSVVALENWSAILYRTQQANTQFVVFFFLALVVVGTFFILNLVLVIVSASFNKAITADKIRKAKGEAEERRKREERLRMRTEKLAIQNAPARDSKKTSATPNNSMSAAATPPIVAPDQPVANTSVLASEEGTSVPIADAVPSAVADAASSDDEDGNWQLLTNVDLIEETQRSLLAPESTAGDLVASPTMTLEVNILNSTQTRTSKRRPKPTGFPGIIRYYVHKKITKRMWFAVTVAIAVVCNVVIMALAYHGMPQSLAQTIVIANIAFLGIFSFEILLKLIGEPLSLLIRDPLNIFDFIVTIACCVELGVSGTAQLSIFRCVRLFRLMYVSDSLKSTIVVLVNALRSVWSLLVLMGLMIFLFALLGMEIFSGKMCGMGGTSPTRVNTSVCNDVPRDNFDNVGYGVLTVFVIIAGDGWRDIATTGMEAVGAETAAYFLLCYMIGGYLLLNLFVAVLLSSKDEIAAQERKRKQQEEEEGKKRGESTFTYFSNDPQSNRFTQGDQEMDTKRILEQPLRSPEDAAADEELDDWDDTGSPTAADITGDPWEMLGLTDTLMDRTLYVKRRREEIEAAKNPLRRFAGRVVDNRIFSLLVLAVIAFSMFSLALHTPMHHPDHQLEQFVGYSDVAVAGFFFIEASLKLLSLGIRGPLEGNPNSLPGYFHNPWNVFDFFLMLCAAAGAVLNFSTDHTAVQVNNYIRLTRALRPLSIVGRNPRLEVIFRSLLYSIPALRNATLLVFIVWIVYGILGTQLFGGRLYACTSRTWGDASYGEIAWLQNRTGCLEAGYNWTTPRQNFDHLGYSMMTLFQICTIDTWNPIMYNAIDAVDFEIAPQPNNAPWRAAYFVSFIVCQTFFMINFFVSVMVDAYFTTKAIIEENMRHTLTKHSAQLLSAEQQDFAEFYRRTLMFVKPPLHIPMASGSVRLQIRRLVRWKHFEAVTFACALVQVASQAVSFHGQPELMTEILFWSDVGFTGFFTLVGFLKFIVYGPRLFFVNKTNILEGSVNICTWAGVGMQIAGITRDSNQVAFAASRLLRLTRVFRLYRIYYITTGIRILFDTLVVSAPNFLSVFFLLFLFFFLFAVVGIRLFGRLHRGPDNAPGINGYANFETFPVALTTLLRVATVDNWNHVMWGAAIAEPACDRHLGDCGRPILANIFFVLFIMMGNWIGINFFTAVLMEAFSKADKQENYVIQEEDVIRFKTLWKEVAGTEGAMSLASLVIFMTELGAPIGPDWNAMYEERMKKVNPKEAERLMQARAAGEDPKIPKPSQFQVMKFLRKIDVPTKNGAVSKDLLFDALIRHFYGVVLPRANDNALRALLAQRFESAQFERQRLRAMSVRSRRGGGNQGALQQILCAVAIQSAWRGARMRKVVQEAVRSKLEEGRTESNVRPRSLTNGQSGAPAAKARLSLVKKSDTDGDKAVEARHTNGTSAGVESGFGSPHVVAEATSSSPIPPPLAPADNVPNHSSRNGMSPEAAHPPLPLKSPLFGPDPQPRPEVKNASFFDEDDAL